MTSESLARLFAESAGLDPDGADALAGKIDGALGAARAAWPTIAMAPETFARHLGRHARSAGAPAAYLESVHAADLYLACAACEHDRAALAAFEEHFMARVPEYVMRVRVGRDVVDEVQQKLRERLVMPGADDAPPKLAEYSGKGALGGWLRVTAVRTALNHLRSSASSSPARAGAEELAVSGDPELAYVKEHAKDLLGDAFKRVLGGLDAKERSILRLHYIEGLTMDQLAHLYKTPRSTIARRVSDARQQLLAATEALLRDERRLSASAVASVIRQARSQLDVTISRLLD
ncbi:MAG TPA: sigma-70 family RNA polymerase sigma factor [Gaiellaceae bacterium]|nr:sigma-70 family RNA polymerase sigma factor [Gaiellaceae bacterium]